MHGPNTFFKTEMPLEEAINMSNLAELAAKDKEYTQRANQEGKAYYKWDTESTIVKLYDDARSLGEWAGIAQFVSTWLAYTLKFEELDDKFMYLFNEFLEGRYHYKDEYLGKKVYKIVNEHCWGYIYSLYWHFLINQNKSYPEYICQLLSVYERLKKVPIWHKLPNEDGSELIDASDEEIKKYMGTWISPEEKEKRRKEYEEFMAKLRKKHQI